MKEIPRRFEDASIYDWSEGHVLRKTMETYLVNFHELSLEGKAPVFLGNSGVGKSRAAAALLNAIDISSSGKVTTAWFSVSESLNILLDYRDMKISSGYANIYSGMISSDVIVFDDFSTLRDSPRLKEYFWMIVENRYTNKRPTIFTGNFFLGDTHNQEDFWRNMALNFSLPFVRRIREIGQNLTVIL